MKMLLSLLLSLVSILYMANSEAKLSPMEKARKAHVSLSTDTGKIFCGGFAVDTHTVATARHCLMAAEAAGVRVYFNGLSCPTDKVVELDYRDHVLVDTCQSYTHTVKLAPPPKVGEHIFVWGHPDGMPLMYREGLLAGSFYQSEEWLDSPAGAQAFLYDFNGWHGDSGSAIYNKKGEVVGMVSRRWGSEDALFRLVGSYNFNFTLPAMRKYGVE